ncbi:hypothetical protein ASF79_11075 [Agreia sp. Leaf335]|nr:hypothetical protein ASF79_11075 [Agreia sp. Leaf335]
MPRLVLGTGAGNVEAELDDLIVRPENRLADRPHPRVVDEFEPPAHLLWMHLDVVALRPAADGPTRAGQRLLESDVDVFAQRVGPFGRQGTLPSRDPIGIQSIDRVLHVDLDARFGCGGCG